MQSNRNQSIGLSDLGGENYVTLSTLTSQYAGYTLKDRQVTKQLMNLWKCHSTQHVNDDCTGPYRC